MSGAAVQGFMGRERQGRTDDSSLKRGKREGWSWADEIQQLWCKHTVEKQQPRGLGSESQMLQLFAARRLCPLSMAFPDTALCTHSCGIISSKCANMQNRPSKGLELKCINDYNIPNSPWAAQTAEHCCPNPSNSHWAGTQFLFHVRAWGRQNLYAANSYLFTFTHPARAGLERKWRDRRWDFSSQLADFISLSSLLAQ